MDNYPTLSLLDTPRVADLRGRVRAAMGRPAVRWACPSRIDEGYMHEPLPVRKARAIALKLSHMPTHTLNGSGHTIDRQKCSACGQCVADCPSRALAIKGEWLSASSIVSRAQRLKPFFDHSGGEVTGQLEFATVVLTECQSRGIHTAIETCGACSWPRLKRLLEHADLVLYDLKLIYERHHRYWTGASNRQILDNARRLAGKTIDVESRVPLVPGITDTEENLRGIFGFMQQQGLGRVALLPYNPAAGAKYEWLDRPYQILGASQSGKRLDELVALAREVGLDATIS
jgi:pyruvate formate lyase activating enzyme